MPTHISARIAWHDNGWDGRVCRDPKANTYCVGRHSYPGEMIAERRELDWEIPLAGRSCHELDRPMPCMYSINAFGNQTIQGYAPPPTWFRDDTKTKYWEIPPATVAMWPYEEMYRDEVKRTENNSGYDAEKRRERVNDFFSQLEPSRSLVFYYSNYSNPFSDNEENRYVVVGVSRLKSIGPELTWVDQSKKMETSYGAYVWQRNITSDYPNQGLRLPYTAYMEQPEILERILFVPDNPRSFKFATRHISDDGALSLIERFVEIVSVLSDIGDKHEAWSLRYEWLTSLIAELWQNRGLYPSLLRIWDYLGFSEAIPYSRRELQRRSAQEVKDEIFAILAGRHQPASTLGITSRRLDDVCRSWRLLHVEQQLLLSDVLSRFDLQTEQIRTILDKPKDASLECSLSDIVENPYLLCEQYVGRNPDDQITFGQIDRGMYASPELGQTFEYPTDNWRRTRALCVEHLRNANQHTFLLAEQVIQGVDRKLSSMPEWKRAHISDRHIIEDKHEFEKALTYREYDNQLYLYRKPIFEDERMVEDTLRALVRRPQITLRFPVTGGHWRTFLYDSSSKMAKEYVSDYEQALTEQIAICQGIFRHPLSILCGAAGTGKTTVVKAIIRAIEQAHGSGSSFLLLAPTGKAADRLRERTGKDARTIHSFLASKGWLNDNMTFKRQGGQREQSYTTFIIDESSMLDLPLLAAFCRAVNWNSVQRVIFVGDPNQLPPIGTGKVFADLIDWLSTELNEHVGELQTNMRQRLNELTGQGTGILKLASIFARQGLQETKSADVDAREEEILEKVLEGGDIDGDLRVLYWQSADDLQKLLIDSIVADMEQDTNTRFDSNRPSDLWEAAMQMDGQSNPEAIQVISPYRGELHGVEHLNQVIQRHKNSKLVERHSMILGGITYFDKVIQILNRPKSNPIWAYNSQTNKNNQIEIFNGEIGVTRVHGFDAKRWQYSNFHVERFQVAFSRKQSLWVGYNSDSDVEQNLELAYAISVHKSQGSEFKRVYFILPKHKRGLLSTELFYTGITRAQTHCTILIQEDISPILTLRRRENSHLNRINSSVFQFRPVPPDFQALYSWYEEGKIHRTLAKEMVRSKSEVIIANILFERDFPFEYEKPLKAPDGTQYLPDFTLKIYGEEWYWEHLGMLHNAHYREHWARKLTWYEKHGFADRLIITQEELGFDSSQVVNVLAEKFGT